MILKMAATSGEGSVVKHKNLIKLSKSELGVGPAVGKLLDRLATSRLANVLVMPQCIGTIKI